MNCICILNKYKLFQMEMKKILNTTTLSDMPCSLVEVDRNLRGLTALMIEAVHTSEKRMYINETTLSNILEGYHIQPSRREKLKYYEK